MAVRDASLSLPHFPGGSARCARIPQKATPSASLPSREARRKAAAPLQARPRRERMPHATLPIQDVLHPEPPDRQGVGDEPPVATPREPLRAHERDPGASGFLHHPLQPALELLALHVVRIAAEPRRLPGDMGGIRPRGATPAQLGQMEVTDPHGGQGRRQGISAEMRMPPGGREPPHVHHPLHPVDPEELQELLQRPVRMPHRPDCGHSAPSTRPRATSIVTGAGRFCQFWSRGSDSAGSGEAVGDAQNSPPGTGIRRARPSRSRASMASRIPGRSLP
jgi:hypothetical protein